MCCLGSGRIGVAFGKGCVVTVGVLFLSSVVARIVLGCGLCGV